MHRLFFLQDNGVNFFHKTAVILFVNYLNFLFMSAFKHFSNSSACATLSCIVTVNLIPHVFIRLVVILEQNIALLRVVANWQHKFQLVTVRVHGYKVDCWLSDRLWLVKNRIYILVALDSNMTRLIELGIEMLLLVDKRICLNVRQHVHLTPVIFTFDCEPLLLPLYCLLFYTYRWTLFICTLLKA